MSFAELIEAFGLTREHVEAVLQFARKVPSQTHSNQRSATDKLFSLRHRYTCRLFPLKSAQLKNIAHIQYQLSSTRHESNRH